MTEAIVTILTEGMNRRPEEEERRTREGVKGGVDQKDMWSNVTKCLKGEEKEFILNYLVCWEIVKLD